MERTCTNCLIRDTAPGATNRLCEECATARIANILQMSFMDFQDLYRMVKKYKHLSQHEEEVRNVMVEINRIGLSINVSDDTEGV